MLDTSGQAKVTAIQLPPNENHRLLSINGAGNQIPKLHAIIWLRMRVRGSDIAVVERQG
jgi:hypothetical protein